MPIVRRAPVARRPACEVAGHVKGERADRQLPEIAALVGLVGAGGLSPPSRRAGLAAVSLRAFCDRLESQAGARRSHWVAVQAPKGFEAYAKLLWFAGSLSEAHRDTRAYVRSDGALADHESSRATRACQPVSFGGPVERRLGDHRCERFAGPKHKTIRTVVALHPQLSGPCARSRRSEGGSRNKRAGRRAHFGGRRGSLTCPNTRGIARRRACGP